MKEPTSMWSGPIRCEPPPMVCPPWIVTVLVPIPSIFAPNVQRKCEILHVRLTGRIAKDRRSSRRGCGNKRILGGGNAGLIEKNVGTDQRLCAELELVVRVNVRAEPFECEEVRVEASATDDVSARRWQRDLATAR